MGKFFNSLMMIKQGDVLPILPNGYQAVHFLSNRGVKASIPTERQCAPNRKFVWDIASDIASVECYFGSDGGIQIAYKDKYGVGPAPRATIDIDITRRNIVSVSLDSTGRICTIESNGLTISKAWGTTYNTECHIFALNKNNYFASAQTFYGLKVYENGGLISNLVPCYRISDNAIGVYDTEREKFLISYSYGGTITIG